MAEQNKNNGGVTLIELIVVIAIVAILAVALGFQYAGWQGRYKVESQVKEIYSNLMSARANAMYIKRPYRVTFGTDTYQVFQATNDAGTAFAPKPGWTTAKRFNYPVSSSWTGTVEFDGRGLVMQPSVWSASFDIRFIDPVAHPDVDADYDCIKLEPTRISLGKWSTKCDVK